MVEVKALSATRADTWLLCRLKYRFNYHSNYQVIKSDHLKLGIAVHDAVEELDKKLAIDKVISKELYDIGLDLFNKSAIKNGLYDKSFYKAGKEMIIYRLDNYNPEEVMKIKGVPAIENKFRLTLDNGVPLVGAFDKVIKIDDNTIGIVDYKTSRVAMSREEASDNIQVKVYDVAARKIFPKKEVVLIWHYLRPGMKRVETVINDENRRFFKSFLKSLYETIESTPRSEMYPSINMFCGWCDYRNYCNAYKSVISSPSEIRPYSEMSEEEFVNEWVKLKNIKKTIDAREREMKMVAHEIVKREGKGIAGESMEIYPQQSSRLYYDVSTVYDLVPEKDFLGMVSVVKKSVDDYIENHPEVRNEILKTASVSYDAPSYRLRKNSKGENR